MTTSTLIDYEHISAQAWKRLEDAADRHDHPMHLMTLATVNRDGGPDARLLVLRGASRDKSRMWFHTDCRSRKVEQLRRQPEVCIVGYDRRDDVQLRVFGHVVLHHGNEIADRHWQQTNMAVRNVYGSPLRPGEPLPDHDPRVHRHQEILESEEADAGRYNFLVVAVDVDRIDWLQVDGAVQRRALLQKDNDWTVEPLAP